MEDDIKCIMNEKKMCSSNNDNNQEADALYSMSSISAFVESPSAASSSFSLSSATRNAADRDMQAYWKSDCICRLFSFDFSFSIYFTLFALLIALAKCAQPAMATAAPPSPSPPPPSLLQAITMPVGAIQHIASATNSFAISDYSSNSKNTNDESNSKSLRLGRVARSSVKYANVFRLKDRPREFTLQRHARDSMGSGILQNEDICKKYCVCEKVGNFEKINCDLTKHRGKVEFDAGLKVPYSTTAVTITLGPETQLNLEEGVFPSIMNSMSIRSSSMGNSQVEFTKGSFNKINGPYPEIFIEQINSVFVRAEAFPANMSLKFNVSNCKLLVLYPKAFFNNKVHTTIDNVETLSIEDNAFGSSEAKLLIKSSNVKNLYKFGARIREIRFVNCNIENITKGTFALNEIDVIVFEKCRIDRIMSQAFTENLHLKQISITDAKIKFIESKAIDGSGITELILKRNIIDIIHSNAIYAVAANTTITNNTIKTLEKNWMSIREWSNVIVEDNKFGVFGGFHLETKNNACRFSRNSLTTPLDGSLNITKYCTMREIYVSLSCRCNENWLQDFTSHDLRSEFYCTIDEKLSHCFNTSSLTFQKYTQEVCNEKKTFLDCGANKNLKKVNGKFFTPEELAARQKSSPRIYYIVAISVGIVAAVGSVVIVLLRRCCKPKSNKNNNTHCHEFSDDDLRILDDAMQIVKKKYPEHYKKINKQKQLLLQTNLSEEKCIGTVAKLGELIDNIPDAGSDFQLLKDVLIYHLQPHQQSQPLPSAPCATSTDPIYCEPGMNGIDGGFYTSSSIPTPLPLPLPTPNYLSEPPTCSVSPSIGSPPFEHIYAEPTCAQPLLRNEYASPADRNLDSLDLYTEPISDRENSIASVRNSNMQQLPQLPQYALPSTSRSQQAAKKLNQSNAFNNVQKIANDLNSNPKFQLSLRRAHDAIPVTAVYTSPDPTRKRPQNRTTTTTTNTNFTSQNLRDSELQGAAALSIIQNDGGSNHSGGSNETVKIDDIIEYVDA